MSRSAMNDPKNLFLLIKQIRQGHEPAFQQLYDATKSRVFNTVLSYVRSWEDAEEVTQDVFVDVFKSAHNFKGDADVTTWIYRITVNKSLDFVKHRKRQKRFAFLTSLFDKNTGEVVHHPPDFVHPGIMLENQENATRLFQGVNALPDKQKTAYILTRIEGLSNIEAAHVMTTSVGAVESLLTRGQRKPEETVGSVI